MDCKYSAEDGYYWPIAPVADGPEGDQQLNFEDVPATKHGSSRRWSLKRLLKTEVTRDRENLLSYMGSVLSPDDYRRLAALLSKKRDKPAGLGLSHRLALMSNTPSDPPNQQSILEASDAARSQSESLQPQRHEPLQTHAENVAPRSDQSVTRGSNADVIAFRLKQSIAQRPFAQGFLKTTATHKSRRSRTLSRKVSHFFQRTNTHVKNAETANSKDNSCSTKTNQKTSTTSPRKPPFTNQDVPTCASTSTNTTNSAPLQSLDTSILSSVSESPIEQLERDRNDSIKKEETLKASSDGRDTEHASTNTNTVSNLDSMLKSSTCSNAENMLSFAPPTKSPVLEDEESFPPSPSESSQNIQESDWLQSSLNLRQVDTLSAEIQQLSFFEKCDMDEETSDDAINRPEELQSDQDGQAADQGSGAGHDRKYAQSTRTSSAQAQSSSKRPNMYSGHGSGAEDSNEEGNEGRKGPTQKKKKTDANERQKRFVCPYQAYEPSLDCLKLSLKNPEGGCAGISRLKQHLTRRHMESYRCRRCWRSLDSRLRARAHEQEAMCRSREMPMYERFMSPENEADVEGVNRSASEVEAWWDLFRLLIPDMRGIHVHLLEPPFGQYTPWYTYQELGPENTSLTLSNNSHEPSAQAAGSEAISLLSSGESGLDISGLSEFTIPDQPPWTPLPMLPAPSQVFPVPSSENSVRGNIGNEHHGYFNNEYASIDSYLDPSFDSPRSSNHTPPSLASSLTRDVSVSTPSHRNQLQRIEYLQKRNVQAKEHIIQLSTKARETFNHLEQMDGLLDTLLDSDLLESIDKTGALFRKISEVSSILASAKSTIQ